MTHKEALKMIDDVLKAENCTWQEKKNRLADIMTGCRRDKIEIEKACEAYRNVLIRHYGLTSFKNMKNRMKVLIDKFKEELRDGH